MKEKESTIKDIARAVDTVTSSLAELQNWLVFNFGNVDKRFNALDNQLEIHDEKIDDIKAVQNAQVNILTKHTQTLNHNKMMSDEHAFMLGQLTKKVSEHTSLLHQIQGDVNMLVSDDMKHETRIKKLDKDTEKIKARVGV